MNKVDIENLLSSKIKNSQLYLDSLTHRSASNINNERLEFFGDAILGLVIAEYLYNKFPDDDEGALSRKRSHLVKKDTLTKIANQYDIGSKVILGKGEKKSGGHNRDSIISDALEALIGVVYLIEGLKIAKKFIYEIFNEQINSLPENDDLKDSKTKLQELLQSYSLPLPRYETTEINIKNKISFKTICIIKDYDTIEEGNGSNKRKSQQEAAIKALEKINTILKK
ncbi:MAG: ribonuclease III [Gammaproteobacteria bacterium]|jgi:ribonuclease III|nr:ribonuclease III [Gammaproteobacteria bacterium]MBT7603979.1 ribonuclease III [Gammaproteobacteria bacterium]